jgi:UDP-N-acetylmuramoylalanine--D-glutamate ligase
VTSLPTGGPDELRAAGAWRGVNVCVAGVAVSGCAAARALAGLGAQVLAVDARDGAGELERARALAEAGVRTRLGASTELPDPCDLVVVSPGWRPDHPMLVAAAARGVPVWGEVELAWRLRPHGARGSQCWLGVTGTNGKTTTVEMLASILAAAGINSVAAGNVGLPMVDAVLHDPPYDVLAVEVSSFQLHWMHTVEFEAAAILNIAEDHLDWHGSFAAYLADKEKVWNGDPCAVYNGDDAVLVDLSGGHQDTHCFTLGRPDDGCFGVRGDVLVDRVSGPRPEDRVSGSGGVELCRVDDLASPAPHNVANALAAAALARALSCSGRFEISPEHVAAGLRAYRPGAHRITPVGTVDGVTFVDDSKATNPHAATASLQAFDHVVWVAGGLAKGARFDDVVRANAGRLRGAVLMGRDRALVAEALARHAPDVPVEEVADTDTGAMDVVVRAAAGLARPGDTVLLAPACASMDMFTDYAARGDAFAAAVRRLGG